MRNSLHYPKRAELLTAPAAKRSAKVLSFLPKAAETYRRRIAQGLDGEPRAALKARVILRDLIGGRIRLVPESLWADTRSVRGSQKTEAL